MRKSRTLIESFTYAIAGIVYSIKTQRNMCIHFSVAVLVFISAVLLKIDYIEMSLVFFAISLVILTEMINTAIEKTIDLFTKEYHPLAKIAKNVAAGAVLVSALNAVVIGFIIFYARIATLIKLLLKTYLR